MAEKDENGDFSTPLKINVTKSFPFRTLLSVRITKEGKYAYDKLEISKEEAVYLFEALSNILEVNKKPVIVQKVMPDNGLSITDCKVVKGKVRKKKVENS